MNLYLAGVNGRHSIIQEHYNNMQIYLAGNESARNKITESCKEDDMNIYLAGIAPWRNVGLYDEATLKHRPYILESFYYVDKDTERLLPFYGDFLLDSGAFTFMQDSKTAVNWDEYIERYAAFIVKNNVTKFFELDIDSIVGYDKVLQYRQKLETLTQRKCIPVWHNSRGKEEFVKMCKNYPYVAIGGLVSGAGEYGRQYWKYFPWFISTAHKYGAKIHGLGFTSLEGIQKYHFDSVDSTAWTAGNRFGFVYHFDGKTLQKIKTPKGKRIVKPKECALINYLEWIRFQIYAKEHL